MDDQAHDHWSRQDWFDQEAARHQKTHEQSDQVAPTQIAQKHNESRPEAMVLESCLNTVTTETQQAEMAAEATEG